jgi:hypothetical protein
VTRDGEHANYHGSRIMAKIFAETLMRWFYDDIITEKEQKMVNGNK